ncbi:MAG: DUF523 and DUF1722 domain-containing protein [Deltaproteobacteria bacterium]|nr:DUF523 and DUF1722 domain-containing protein [Deltaproteobacteria bacterium]
MPSAVRLIRIGISSCLLGQRVRYDGGHKRDGFLTDVLGRFVEWVPVCPEVEVGMGIPRPTLRLVRRGDDLRMVAERSGEDHTRAMRSFARKRVAALRKLDLAGYVLKKDSPSCGMERVRLYGEKGMPEKKGRGLFAQALLEGIPQLPIEEEGRLQDPALRENFIERVFAYRRLRGLFRGRWSVGSLVAFHAAHKLQLMSHEPQAYPRLGRLVGEAKGMDRDELRSRYTDGFMEALVRKATPRRNVNAMHHMLGFFRKHLDARSKQELLGLIEDYRNGRVPLVVPLTLIRHHVERCDIACLRDQHYLAPHPKELMLRNHV